MSSDRQEQMLVRAALKRRAEDGTAAHLTDVELNRISEGIALTLRAARRDVGLTLQEFASLAFTSPNSVWRYENSRTQGRNLVTLVRLATYLGLQADVTFKEIGLDELENSGKDQALTAEKAEARRRRGNRRRK